MAEAVVSRAGRESAAPRPVSRMMAAESRAVAIARGSRGVVDLAELKAAGLDKDAIARRVQSGWLTRHFESVYSIGDLDELGRIAAALRAAGPEAMAASGSAAAMEDLLPYPAAVHVANPRGAPRPKAVVVSQPRRTPDWTRRHGLKLTTVPETLLALAALHYGDAQHATDQAFIARKATTASLSAFLGDKTHHRGVAVLRDIVEGPRTRSHLERLFFKLLRDARLPLPLTNVKVSGHLVDFYWPGHRLVVETDGWASHGRRSQWESDHARDLDHFGAGVTSLRITYLQVTRRQLEVVARLGARLL